MFLVVVVGVFCVCCLVFVGGGGDGLCGFFNLFYCNCFYC